MCESPIKLFTEVLGYAEQDALAYVCESTRTSTYKKTVGDIRTVEREKAEWIRNWEEKYKLHLT
jgi:hypothetical protein